MNLGFQDMFEPFVLDGSKTHSIRAGDRWKVGMRADCYVRPRQKGMRLLFRAPVVRVEPVEIRVLTGHIDGWPRNELCPLHLKTVVLIDGTPLDKDEREAFAWRDGFRQAHFKGSFFLMMWFWRKTYNLERKPFRGQLVHWDYANRFMEHREAAQAPPHLSGSARPGGRRRRLERGMPYMKHPRTPEEWQLAVDLAEGALCLDSARKYGLVTGGPEINVLHCEWILGQGLSIGITPSNDAVNRFIADVQGVKA